MTRLHFADVSRRFGRREVLHGIDLGVEEGERVLLVGPNGAGKTTLLRLAAGLLRPTTGTVTVGRHAPTAPAGRRHLAYVPQDAPTYAELTAQEHVQWWGRVHGRPVDGRAWLAQAGLSRLAHEPCAVLSRGQRQRLSIAMALATGPTLLLLDEPATALDAAGQAWLEELLQASDAAMLVASHDPAWARLLGARSAVLEGGTLA